jgi:hypothetical protein
MNVYLYIAESNPDDAYQICQKYGYFDLRTINDLSDCLRLIVAQNGESAFNEIMQLHPDRQVIIDEVVDKTKEKPEPPIENVKSLDGGMVEVEPKAVESCSCNKNAEGDKPSPLVNHTNLYILIGSLVIAMAIVVSIKNK